SHPPVGRMAPGADPARRPGTGMPATSGKGRNGPTGKPTYRHEKTEFSVRLIAMPFDPAVRIVTNRATDPASRFMEFRTPEPGRNSAQSKAGRKNGFTRSG
ncbi:hypothetical protein, partial [Streptomyces sp. FH025]|uniref:hypothetical protein n=1 Tax=Streptomyces sp. FH025 TaxID=2815937 RepID=UPI001A9CB9E3